MKNGMLQERCVSEKLRPPNPGVQQLVRDRLIKQVSQIKDGPSVLLLVAPAGYGKTSLVSSWLTRQKYFLHIWLSLDTVDLDMSRFMRYLLLAFSKVSEQAPIKAQTALPLITLEESISLIDDLICEIGELDRPIAFVLDGLHNIGDEGPPLKQIVAYLVEHAPTNLRIILLSRHMTRIGLSKLRLENRLLVIDESQLAFTQDETNEFFRLQGINLPEAHTQQIQADTGGWPAFVKLAADTLLLGSNHGALLGENLEFIDAAAEYMNEEVVSALDKKTVSFALAASLIEPLSASLAEKITRWERAEVNAAIRTLVFERLVLQKSKRRENEPWFVFRPPIALVLQQQFHRQSDMSSRTIFENASLWFEENGKYDLSARFAIKNRNWRHVVEMINQHWQTMALEDKLHLTYQWGRSLPRELLLTEPRTCSILSFAAVLYGDAAFTAFCEDVAGKHFTDPHEDFYTESVVFHLQVCNIQGRYEEARQTLPIALSRIGDMDFLLVHWVRQHETVLSENPDWLRFRNMILEFLPLTQMYCSETFVSNNYSILSMCESFLGNLNKALDYALLGMHSTKETHNAVRASSVNIHFAHMIAAFYRGDIAEAEYHQEKYDQTLREYRLPYFLSLSLAYKATFKFFSSDKASVGDLVAASAKASPYGLLMAPMSIEMIRSIAGEKAFDFRGFMETTCVGHEHSFAWQRLRFVYGLIDERQELLPELRELMDTIEEERTLDRINAYLLYALYCQKYGSAEDSLQSFRSALELAEPEDIIQPLCNDFAWYIPILSQLDEISEVDSFAQKLFVRLSQLAHGEISMVRKIKEVSLTPREEEVLYQIVSGYKTDCIAERLGISKQTVRKHISNIYEKYDVHSRTQLLLRTL
ncbi:MAG: LuxR C-terminal-related transcriptional regulator [Eggerthellaceae bacterium]|nr:LuxR C-terminal-related transcriptional regulator [Eggerthellaceae bacterium]